MDNKDSSISNDANATIAKARRGCVERGEGRGVCHVFLDGATVCCCGERRLITK